MAARNGDPRLAGDATDEQGKRSVTLIYPVNQLIGSTPEEVLDDALQAPGLPQNGDAYPSYGIQVTRRVARYLNLQDPTAADVEITWSTPTENLIRDGGISGSGYFESEIEQVTVEIFEDQAGTPMRVQYQGLTGTRTRTVTARIERAVMTYTLSKDFATWSYTDQLKAFSTNNAVFGPFAANTLLFRGAAIAEQDTGLFRHRYRYSHNPDGWQLFASIFFSGLVPEDAEETFPPGGIAKFDVRPAIDFSLFPVSFANWS